MHFKLPRLSNHPWILRQAPSNSSINRSSLIQFRFFNDLSHSQSNLSSQIQSEKLKQKKKEPKEHLQSKKKKSPAKKLVPPKRPMNIMQLVTQDVISEIKAKTSQMTKEDARDCFRIAAEKYRALTEADKQKYTIELDRRRDQYELEMKKFLDSLTPDDYINQNEYIRRRKAQGRSISRKGIPRLDPNAPKRPLNGFMIFCADLRTNPSKYPDLHELIQSAEKDGNQSITEGSKVLANYWKSMPEDVKEGYILEGQRRRELYKLEKARYDAQVKELSENLQSLRTVT
ncbi:hypothetical protein O181_012424 [Austropuccinia psidii MF-1]|uniref:HMG box domain-containing protein n=1 Tax=Austropuccinia psidii MF-1 TaxID=1389203 RepID=A0A9Q3BUM4_9BASI|nr:hypothetical protein [Austropuccinia psidii MF-1]